MEEEEAGGRKEMGVENPSFVGDKEDIGNGKLNGTVPDSGSGGLEAINLELVNMNPYAVKDGDVDGEKGKDGNGYIAAEDVVRPRKGTDDLDPEHPDDEYFVSSPSRKKGIRGEKFYLSSRPEEKCCSRKLLVTAAIFALAAAIGILVGSLAANGVLHSKEKQESMAEFSKTPLSNEIDDEFGPVVEQALEGQLKLTDANFLESYKDPSSVDFQEMAMAIEGFLRQGLAEEGGLTADEEGHLIIRVIEFSPGSLVCTFRMSWLLHRPFLTPDSVSSALSNYMKKSNERLGPYHAPVVYLRIYYIRNRCEQHRGGCSHWCTFSLQLVIFKCECPPGMRLALNHKTCIPASYVPPIPTTSSSLPLPTLPATKEPERETSQEVTRGPPPATTPEHISSQDDSMGMDNDTDGMILEHEGFTTSAPMEEATTMSTGSINTTSASREQSETTQKDPESTSSEHTMTPLMENVTEMTLPSKHAEETTISTATVKVTGEVSDGEDGMEMTTLSLENDTMTVEPPGKMEEDAELLPNTFNTSETTTSPPREMTTTSSPSSVVTTVRDTANETEETTQAHHDGRHPDVDRGLDIESKTTLPPEMIEELTTIKSGIHILPLHSIDAVTNETEPPSATEVMSDVSPGDLQSPMPSSAQHPTPPSEDSTTTMVEDITDSATPMSHESMDLPLNREAEEMTDVAKDMEGTTPFLGDVSASDIQPGNDTGTTDNTRSEQMTTINPSEELDNKMKTDHSLNEITARELMSPSFRDHKAIDTDGAHINTLMPEEPHKKDITKDKETLETLLVTTTTKEPDLEQDAMMETTSVRQLDPALMAIATTEQETTVTPSVSVNANEMNNSLDETTTPVTSSGSVNATVNNDSLVGTTTPITINMTERSSSLKEAITSPTVHMDDEELTSISTSELETTAKSTTIINTMKAEEQETITTAEPHAGVTEFPSVNATEDTLGSSSEVVNEKSKTTLPSTIQGLSIQTEEPTLSLESLFTSQLDAISDEPRATQDKKKLHCQSGEFECHNSSSMPVCIPNLAVCDSIIDCVDGSDEDGCIKGGCANNFQCASGQCIQYHLVCNGITDCRDGSDELACENVLCETTEFMCNSGRCIPESWVCDGKDHCGDGSDEESCSTQECNSKKDLYLCQGDDGKCLPESKLCDRETDCPAGDDESQCWECEGDFQCAHGGCTTNENVCNGGRECRDGSDEYGCFSLREEDGTLLVNSRELNYLPVCGDTWDKSLSNAVCRDRGYWGALSTEFSPLDENTWREVGKFDVPGHVLVLRHQPMGFLLPFFKVIPAEQCQTKKTVRIKCQPFSCGTWNGVNAAGDQGARMAGLSQEGTWPSVATLLHTSKRKTCTGSIISPLWVITAYSCIENIGQDPEEWLLLAGAGMVGSNSSSTSSQLQLVEAIIPHPRREFVNELTAHDVALVRLKSPMLLAGSLGISSSAAICLPEKSLEPRQLCVTAGGGIATGGIHLRQQVFYLPVPTIDIDSCNSSLHLNGNLRDDMICAGFTDVDRAPCRRDVGAPLMCVSESGGWELQGVLSQPMGCGRSGHPAVYAAIHAESPWIHSVIGGSWDTDTGPGPDGF